jgi:non-heme Fe2+,alpha-ketoglutarate-dependent halogenase
MTDSNIDNGCLRFIPGSHGVMFYDENKEITYDTKRINSVTKNGEKTGFFGYDFSELKIDKNWNPDESKSVSLEMKAGQFIIFWSTLLHASHPHNGKNHNMRLGYTARYVPTSVKVYPDIEALEEFGGTASLKRYHSVLVSGQDEYDYNDNITDLPDHTIKKKP